MLNAENKSFNTSFGKHPPKQKKGRSNQNVPIVPAGMCEVGKYEEFKNSDKSALGGLPSAAGGLGFGDSTDKLMDELMKTNFSLANMKVDVETEDEKREKQDLVIAKIKKMRDVFSPYSKKDRETFLMELELICKCLTLEQIIYEVVPVFNIFSDEKDEMKMIMLENLPKVVECICRRGDIKIAADHTIINILPVMSTIIEKNSGDVQEKCINSLEEIFIKHIGKDEGAVPIFNMVSHLMENIGSAQENIKIGVLKMMEKFGEFFSTENLNEFIVNNHKAWFKSEK